MEIELASIAFSANERIPLRYSGDGEDLSPPLTWNGVPPETAELALICDDPDAPTPEPWVHWVIYGLKPDLTALPEGLATTHLLTDPITARQGLNTWGKSGYKGPAPPHGHGLHHYHFTLYALKKTLGLKPGLDKAALKAAMQGQILAEVCLTGTYQR